MAVKEKKEKKEKKVEKAEKVEKASSPEAEVETTEPAPSSKRKAEVDEIEINIDAPEPPSKKARRALKKGKALPTKTDSDDEGKGEGKDKKDKTRSEHGVWIGNLPFTVTPAELRKWLVDNSGGALTDEMMTRVKLPSLKEPGRDKSVKPQNKGFAYVDFSDMAAKFAAIALTETELNGRKLLIKDSKSFEGRPKKEEPVAAEGEEDDPEKKTEKKQELNASRKVFVGNMSFKTTEEDLSRNFEKCGEIEWAKVATFEDSGKCKGFGWVKFKEPEAAAWAVKGFVKIKERIETEEDFKSPDDEDDQDSEDDEKAEKEKEKKKKAAQQQKQFKTRKWWINRLLGRELKIELAEDDQLRYKKRFRKDPQNGDGPRSRAPREGGRRDGDKGGNEGGNDGGIKPLKESEDINVARLTGGLVKHTGTKMSFD